MNRGRGLNGDARMNGVAATTGEKGAAKKRSAFATPRNPQSASDTPVAIIAFRRPDTTKQVLDAVRQWRPRRMHLICDGPRGGDDLIACKETRAVLDGIDWECEVRRDYADNNLGLRERVQTGLTTMFKSTDRAIILEDDCVPSPSFHGYCDTLLDRYAGDDRVGLISGDNAHGRQPEDASYYFSRFALIWGWATWARSWEKYQLGYDHWPDARDSHFLYSTLRSRRASDWWTTVIEKNHDQGQSWATIWLLSNLLRGALCAIPSRNLISNIGFGVDATHTTGANAVRAAAQIETLRGALAHPREVAADDYADRLIDKIVFTKDPHVLHGGPGVRIEQIHADAMRRLLTSAGVSTLAGNMLIATYFRHCGEMPELRRDRADMGIYDTRELLRSGRIDLNPTNAGFLDEIDAGVERLLRAGRDLRPWRPAPTRHLAIGRNDAGATRRADPQFCLIAATKDGEIAVRARAPLRRPLVKLKVDGAEITTARGVCDASGYVARSNGADIVFQLPKRLLDGERHQLEVCAEGLEAGVRTFRHEIRALRASSGEIAHYSRDGEIGGHVEVGGLLIENLVCRLVVNGEDEIPFTLGSADLKRMPEVGTTRFSFRLRLPVRLRDARPVGLALVLEEADGRRVLAERVVVLDNWRPTRIGARSPVRTLTIVEPTLTGDRGHMLSMTQLAVEVAHDLGLEAEVFSHEAYAQQGAIDAPVTPHFRKSPYEIASLQDPAEIGRRLARDRAIFLEDLKALDRRIDPADRLFFYPTVNEFFIQSIADFWAERTLAPGENHLICLMLETGMVDRDDITHIIDADKVARFRAAFETIEEAGAAKAHVSAVSATHMRHYQTLTAAPILQMPTFFGRSRRAFTRPVSAAPGAAKGRAEVLLYMGEAKANKGFAFVPEQLRALRAADVDATFHVQISNAEAYPDLAAAAEEIRALSGDDLRIWEGFLPRQQYLELLDAADAVVLAYDPDRYAGKTSGVFWEAQSVAVPVVVPADTWLEREARQGGLPHEAFRGHSAHEIATALRSLLRSNNLSRPAPFDVFEEVRSFFSEYLTTYCGGAPTTFADLFSGSAAKPAHDQAARSFRAAAALDLAADDKTAFGRGWSNAFTTGHNLPGRWMSAESEVEMLVTRDRDREVVIEAEQGPIGGPPTQVEIRIDGAQALDVRVEAENQHAIRIRALLPRRADAGAPNPTRMAIGIPHANSLASPDTETDQLLLVNSITVR